MKKVKKNKQTKKKETKGYISFKFDKKKTLKSK